MAKPLSSNFLWTPNNLHEAIPLLANNVDYLSDKNKTLIPLLEQQPISEILTNWLDTAATQLGLELHEVELAYSDLEAILAQSSPAILELPNSNQTRNFLLLSNSNGNHLTVLGKDGSQHKLGITEVRNFLVSSIEEPLKPNIDKIIKKSNINTDRQDTVTQALLDQQLSTAKIQGCWLLRLPPSENFFTQLRHANFSKRLAWIIATSLLAQILMLLSWIVIGKQVFQGNVDIINFQLWGLLLITIIPLQLINLQLKNRLSLDFGGLLRNRLLSGILQLKPEEIRHKGSGYFLGHVMDIELLEAMGFSMAFMALIAILETLIAAIILSLGAGGLLHSFLLLLWLGFIGFLSWIYYQRLHDWLAHYSLMTRDLVERMVGHRSRIIQEKPENRHDEEDLLLSRYAHLSIKLDNIEALMQGVAGRRGWLPISLLWLLTVFLSTTTDMSLLIVSIGGILLAAVALDHLTQSVRRFLEAMITWQQLRPLYTAASRERNEQPPKFISRLPIQNPILQAEGLHFSYSKKGKTILKNNDLTIEQGKHLLLNGESGSGKSTLAALLAGLQIPEKGRLHLYGLTLEELGENAWRKKVVIAPQFNENYVLTETFAFNLLMGRRWPPTNEDLAKAETICKELKLGELLETMPAGLQQMVGEGGWRLSHGERSRLFIARTLLQKADLIILDESFATLDPETLKISLSCVLRRSNALLLIAHP